MIDYSMYRLSQKRLEEQHENYLHGDPTLPQITREGIAESVIQRIETCYDCLWKVLKRYLIEVLGIADVPNSPKPILRQANESALLPAPLELWFRYADARTTTFHDYDGKDYDGKKAAACLVLVPGLLEDAIDLYETISGETWQ